MNQSNRDHATEPSDRIRQIVGEAARCRSAGEIVDIPQLVARYPDLMPELEQELRRTFIETARALAQSQPTGSSLQTLGTDQAPDHQPRHYMETLEIGNGGSERPQHELQGSFPGYLVLREIQRGGQGVVYEAFQESTKRKVAIKVLIGGACASESTRKRFEREIELVAQLKHPNIIRIYDSGVTPDKCQYYVMDYVRGVPLTQYVRDNECELASVLRMFIVVCETVQHAHQRGIIHRDLKPSNVLVDARGNPKLLDFGFAKLIAAVPIETLVSFSQQIVGTLPYMSPEQTRGNADEIDTRSDVYSLGVMLYELLTGHYPYPVTGPLPEIMKHISETPPIPPSRRWDHDLGVAVRSKRDSRSGHCPIDDEIETIVVRCLDKKSERRYQSTGELARDIQRYLRGEAIEAKRDSRLYLLRKAIVTHKRGFISAALSVLLVVVGTLALLQWRSSQQRSRAHHLLLNAVQVIGRRTNLPEAESLLNQSLELDPEGHETLMQRGILRSIRGLQQPLENKQTFFSLALQDVLEAHKKAGGYWPDLLTTAPWADGPPLDGSRDALHYAVQLFDITGRSGESMALLSYLEHDAATARGADTDYPAPIYDLHLDPLVTRPSADSPGAARLSYDRMATVHRTLLTPIATLNPYYASSYGSYVTELMFDSLFVLDARMNIVKNNAVVKDWQHEGEITIIKLKPDLYWHDGHPFTAEDVVYSLDNVPPEQEAILNAFDQVVVVNRQRLEFHHREATAHPQLLLDFPIIPKHHYEALQARHPNAGIEQVHDRFGTNPLGNGPYRVSSWDAGKIELKRWEDYPGDAPFIDRVVFHILDDHSRDERFRKLASGLIDESELTARDFRWDVNGASFDDKIIKLCAPRWCYDYICWNMDAARCSFFVDRRVRRALTMGINLESIIAQRHEGLYEACHGPFHPRSWMAAQDTRPIEYDPLEAQRLLDDAGWRRGPHGVRWREGRQFEFTLLVPETRKESRLVMVDIAAQLRKLGIVMKLKPMAWNEMRNRFRSGEFDAFTAGTISQHPQTSRRRWGTKQVANYGGYSNPRVDQLFTLAATTDEPEAQRRYYQTIHELIYEQQPYTFLWFRPTLWAVNRQLRGVEVGDNGIVGFNPGARAWWFPARGQ